jgi:hypothetical protein
MQIFKKFFKKHQKTRFFDVAIPYFKQPTSICGFRFSGIREERREVNFFAGNVLVNLIMGYIF